MLENYFLNLNYSPIHLLEQMYYEAMQDSNYYLSPVQVLRCDVSTSLRKELSKIINVPFADCGFLKTKSNNNYKLHVDAFRISAVNMPMFNQEPGFESKFLVIENAKSRFESIDYSKDMFTLMNVTKPHCVENKSTSDRFVLSIGIKEHSYDHLLNLHKESKLLNVTL